jgi:hypothetical protein
VYPGVRSPLLLPTDYIRKYSSIYVIYSLFTLSLAFAVVVKTGFSMLQLWLRCGLISGSRLSGWVGML